MAGIRILVLRRCWSLGSKTLRTSFSCTHPSDTLKHYCDALSHADTHGAERVAPGATV